MEYFSGQTVTAIEWADKGLALLPQDRIEITLSHRTAQSRLIQLSATGPTSEDVLARARRTRHAPPRQGSDKKGTTRS
jgi:tRNA A37 threonylcarbamoyladenosine biosynthesis protein TsaE